MRNLIAIAILLGLAGCASTAVPDPRYDEGYMAKVEQGARLAGAKVIWLTPPNAQKAAAQTQSM